MLNRKPRVGVHYIKGIEPELVEDEPVTKLRLIQDELKMLPQIRIKLVSHLTVLSN